MEKNTFAWSKTVHHALMFVILYNKDVPSCPSSAIEAFHLLGCLQYSNTISQHPFHFYRAQTGE
jgi:hypothetical protein